MTQTAYYSEKNLETHRPSPLSDQKIKNEITNVLTGGIDKNIDKELCVQFIQKFEQYIFSSTINRFKGHLSFQRKDVILGCTQYIDNLYMQGNVQVFENDYRYHERLGRAYIIKKIENLKETVPLIIAMPFPSTGDMRKDMQSILNQALIKNIPVHIDGAWMSCCKDIEFDFNHPAIVSFASSLSKGLGLGWNRIGVRWHKDQQVNDSISLMNDYNMVIKAAVKIGMHFMQKFPMDYLWTEHQDHYKKICKDFNLLETKCIHLAMSGKGPLGVSKLINYLETHV
jgi:hypothetical protein